MMPMFRNFSSMIPSKTKTPGGWLPQPRGLIGPLHYRQQKTGVCSLHPPSGGCESPEMQQNSQIILAQGAYAPRSDFFGGVLVKERTIRFLETTWRPPSNFQRVYRNEFEDYV